MPQIPKDEFLPVKKEDVYMRMPAHLNVYFISDPKDIIYLKSLVGAPIVGVDCEWRTDMVNRQYGNNRKDSGGVAIMQLSSHFDAFVIDMIALCKNPVLDNVLCEIFNGKSTILLGFAF